MSVKLQAHFFLLCTPFVVLNATFLENSFLHYKYNIQMLNLVSIWTALSFKILSSTEYYVPIGQHFWIPLFSVGKYTTANPMYICLLFRQRSVVILMWALSRARYVTPCFVCCHWISEEARFLFYTVYTTLSLFPVDCARAFLLLFYRFCFTA